MQINDPNHVPFKLAAYLALLTACLGAALLTATWLNLPLITAFDAGFQPVAPLTCWLFMMVSTAILLSSKPHISGQRLVLFQVLLWMGLSGSALITMSQLLTGVWFPGLSALPATKVSILTAGSFTILNGALLLQGPLPENTTGLRRQMAAVSALIPLLGSFVVTLSYLAGVPLLYRTGWVPMAFPTAVTLVLLGLAVILRSGYGAWPVSLFSFEGGLLEKEQRFATLPLGAFVLLSFGMLLGGTVLLREHRRTSENAVAENLQAVGELKVSQLSRWLEDRKDDVAFVGRVTLLQQHLAHFLEQSPTSTSLEINPILRKIAAGNFSRVDLFDPKGTLRGSSNDTPEIKYKPEVAAFQPGEASPRFMDLQLGQDGSAPWFGFSLPIWSGSKPAGTLVFQIDPTQYLYSLIQSWPGSSQSAESLLVRRESEHVLFLNELRHQKGTALRLRISMVDNPEVLAVKAVKAQTGLVTGVDYREKMVLGWLQPVKKTPWLLVVKQDASEIFGPLQKELLLLASILTGMVLTLAMALSHWTHRYSHFAATTRLQVEQEGRAVAQRFKALMDQARDVILLTDSTYHITDYNLEACRIYGLTPKNLLQFTLCDLADPSEEETQRANLETIRSQGEGRYECLHRSFDGSVFPVEVGARWVEVEGQNIFLAFIRDIRERKAQEERIRRLTKLYAALSQVNQAITRETDRQALFQKVCEALVDFGPFSMAWMGWVEPGETLVRQIASSADHTSYLKGIPLRLDGSTSALEPAGQAIVTDKPAIYNDLLDTCCDTAWSERARIHGFGSIGAFPIHLLGRVCGAIAVYSPESGLFGKDEEALLVETAGDVSFFIEHEQQEIQRKKTEALLASSERFLREAQEAGQVGTYIWDIRQDAWSSSAVLDGIFGIDEHYIRNLTGWLNLVAPEMRDQIKSYLANLFVNKQPFEAEYAIVRPLDGAHRWVYGRGLVDWDTEGRPISLTGTILDITTRRENENSRRLMESRLQQTQRMESLGKLAGGVAHDMNNVLAAILSLSSTLKRQADPESPEAKSYDTIVSACLRGRGVVKSLLCFAKMDLEETFDLDLNDIVQETVQLLSHTTLKRVRLEMDLDAQLPRLLGDPNAISHAIMNICINAIDAMNGVGMLFIRTGRLPEGGLLLGVRDTGPGMSDEVKERAFEPFFTTKGPGQGTGLGLSMVFGTMKAHEGTLEIDTAAGKGTEIKLIFPPSRILTAPISGKKTEAYTRPDAAEGLSVLVVDDDDLVRQAVTPLLEMLGHQPKAVPSGEKALQLLASGTKADLILLDMNMPGLNGQETLENILKMQPDQRVLMASGYSDCDIKTLTQGRPHVSNIHKPFTLDELRQKIEELTCP